jgi:ZIP family zinc transporter
MSELSVVLLLTLVAGLSIPIGALFARAQYLRPRWIEREVQHGVVGFGGGTLLAAVALVLVPGGRAGARRDLVQRVRPLPPDRRRNIMGFDVALSRSKTSASQLAAMLSDFVPEALALGATFAQGSHGDAVLVRASSPCKICQRATTPTSNCSPAATVSRPGRSFHLPPAGATRATSR